MKSAKPGGSHASAAKVRRKAPHRQRPRHGAGSDARLSELQSRQAHGALDDLEADEFGLIEAFDLPMPTDAGIPSAEARRRIEELWEERRLREALDDLLDG